MLGDEILDKFSRNLEVGRIVKEHAWNVIKFIISSGGNRFFVIMVDISLFENPYSPRAGVEV